MERKIKKVMLLLLCGLLFTACYRTEKAIDKSVDNTTHKATGYNQRVRYIILHYTAANRKSSIETLTKARVSAHYLVTDDPKDPVYQLVSLDKRAWHAGVSAFGSRTNLNDTSVGIEIVNLGYKQTNINIDPSDPIQNIGSRVYYPYTEDQKEKVAKLLLELIEKYNIKPKNVLGHSDIAPTRKQDPGPLFPWEMLYKKYNIGAWYDKADFDEFNNEELYESYTTADIQSELRKYGYGLKLSGEMNGETIKVIAAFQAHFRPDKVTGEMDLETFAILKALNKKYS